MRRILMVAFIAVVPLVLIACTPEERNVLEEAEARLNEGPLFDYADEHLSQASLAAAVPEPFEFVRAERKGFDQHGKEWVTVGVRMDGPVDYARAIFSIHPDEAHARAMFVEQAEDIGRLDKAARGRDPQAAPWSQEDMDVENRCFLRSDRLFWCHAHKGQVCLVVESSAGAVGGDGDVTPKERTAARALMRAFGTYLKEEVPEE